MTAKCADACIESAIIRTENRPVCELTAGQLASLLEGVVYKVISECEKPKELTPIFLSRPQAATTLGISVSTLDKMIKAGDLPAVMVGRRLMINADVIRNLRENGELIL